MAILHSYTLSDFLVMHLSMCMITVSLTNFAVGNIILQCLFKVWDPQLAINIIGEPDLKNAISWSKNSSISCAIL